jgi:hypothetical protein
MRDYVLKKVFFGISPNTSVNKFPSKHEQMNIWLPVRSWRGVNKPLGVFAPARVKPTHVKELLLAFVTNATADI